MEEYSIFKNESGHTNSYIYIKLQRVKNSQDTLEAE